MSITSDSLLDINLSSEPQIDSAADVVLYQALVEIHEAIVILQNEVERIRIATGTAAPP